MPKKKHRPPNAYRKIFLDALDVLKPFATEFQNSREIDSVKMAKSMYALLLSHGDETTSGPRAICSAWHWLSTDEDIRPEIDKVSENSVASDFWMAFWWLGTFHGMEASESQSQKASRKQRNTGRSKKGGAR